MICLPVIGIPARARIASTLVWAGVLQRLILDAINEGEIELTDLLYEIRKLRPELTTTAVVRAVAELITELALIPTHIVHVRIVKPFEEIQ